MQQWQCHAKPAVLGGVVCGAVNTPSTQVIARVFSAEVVCCAKCGCTKHTGENRRAKCTDKRCVVCTK